ncbi:MAG: leucine-rich repeat protein [Prevotella sp.]|nr:leucine-rich repeat protein [Prevotella sp.]
MKKQLISLVLALLPVVANAYDVKKDDIYYNLNNTTRTAEVAFAGNTNAYSGEVEIPKSFTYGNTTYNVTSIGDNAFKGCTNLTGVVIPSTVAHFGEDTFFDCIGLKYIISLIENPFEIPRYSFYYNSPSEGVKPLPCMLFVIGGSSQLWNWKRYEGWNVNLYSDDSEFSDNINGVKTKFKVISVKDKTCKLADGFGDIPTTTTGIYTIPETTCGFTVTGIGYGAFMDCSGLTGIIIPNTVTDIELIPFMNCTGLTNITIPSSVKNIEGALFKLTNIKEVKVDAGNRVYDSRDNCNAVIKTLTNTLVSGCKATTIPNSVTAIGDLAFEGIGIEAVDIPEQLTAIGSSAFRNCNKLTSIIIPSSVTTIGSSAFQYCDNLFSVTTMRAQPIAIDENTFSNRANATLNVPARSKAAYEKADYWKEFKEIVEMPAIIDFADANVKALCVANWDTDGDEELSEAEAAVVTNLGFVFKENSIITSFNELRYFTGLTSINDEAFYYCTKLASIVIPTNVTTIGKNAFFDCESLASLTIPSSVTNIDVGAFLDCGYGLNSIVVESGNQKYDSRDNCNAIIETKTNKLLWGCNNTVIPNSVTSIGYSAFSHCLLMESISIPDGVTSIGNGAFYNCHKLLSVDIPDMVTTIGEDAFWHCDALASVTIGKNVAYIGNWAFENCDNLTSVTVRMLSPVSITEKDFTNRTNATLYVPYGCKAAYEAADYWKEFKEIIEMESVVNPGDANGDDEVDAEDIVVITEYMMGKELENIIIKNADMNGDGIINIADIIQITNQILGKE